MHISATRALYESQLLRESLERDCRLCFEMLTQIWLRTRRLSGAVFMGARLQGLAEGFNNRRHGRAIVVGRREGSRVPSSRNSAFVSDDSAWRHRVMLRYFSSSPWLFLRQAVYHPQV